MRITLDPDEVNQDRVVTLEDGRTVELAAADRALLDQIARQLYIHRSSYAHAYRDPARSGEEADGLAFVEEHAPLYRRVAVLQEAAREGRQRRPVDALDLALLLQDQVWTSSSGATLPLTKMTPTHRGNLRAWLGRAGANIQERALNELPASDLARVAQADPWVDGTPLVRRLDALIAAETARERAMDVARQVARSVEFERSGDWPDR